MAPHNNQESEHEEEPMFDDASSKKNKRKIDHEEERRKDIRRWIADIGVTLKARDSACVTLTTLTKQEFEDQWDLGTSIVVGSEMIFNCNYNGIVSPYAEIGDAVEHIFDSRPECQLWVFYGNYYDFFIGYEKRALEGPVLASEIQFVIQETQKMLGNLEKHYEKMDLHAEQKKLEEGGADGDEEDDAILKTDKALQHPFPPYHGDQKKEFIQDTSAIPLATLEQAESLKRKVNRQRNIESSVDSFFAKNKDALPPQDMQSAGPVDNYFPKDDDPIPLLMDWPELTAGLI